MTLANKDNQYKHALFVLDSQPPHLGEVLSVIRELDNYETMLVCIKNRSIIMKVPQVLMIWQLILKQYSHKCMICAWHEDFAEISTLPDQFNGKQIITFDSKIYAHLSSINIPTKLVLDIPGYCTLFIRSSYRQGFAWNWLKKRYGV